MKNLFKSQEIIKVAVHIERNGFAFYKEFASKSKTSSISELFNYLADEEAKHRKIFESFLEEIGDYTPAENYPGEYEFYLNALAGENIFTKDNAIDIANKKISSDIQAIELAIGFEKDSIIFFNGMQEFSPQDDHGVIQKIINEEKIHLGRLIELKNKSS